MIYFTIRLNIRFFIFFFRPLFFPSRGKSQLKPEMNFFRGFGIETIDVYKRSSQKLS